MAIQYSEIPEDQMLPLVFAEFSGSAPAGADDLVNPSLLLGQKLSTGTATVGVEQRVFSPAQAVTLFGRGSSLARQCARFFQQFPAGDLRAIALADVSEGTAASATITITGPSTAAGSVFLRVGDDLVEVAVASGADPDDVAAALAAAINANLDLPVTAAVAPNEHVVTVTHRHKGTVGNQVALTLNALGQPGNEVTPAGLGLALSHAFLASGATDPAVASYVTAMGDAYYDGIAPHLFDTTTLNALRTELARRWTPNVGLRGHVFGALIESAADAITFAEGRNDPHYSFLALRESTVPTHLTPVCEVAAAYLGLAARLLGNDPGANLQYGVLRGVWGGTDFTSNERQQLAKAGAGTAVRTASGELAVEAEVTTYTKNSAGARNNAWQYTQRPYLLTRFERLCQARFKTRYPDFKLGDDGNPFSAGQKVITPSVAKAEVVSVYAEMVGAAQMENIAEFKNTLRIERHPTNRNRLNGLVKANLIDHLRVVALRVDFQ
jgi:phage tail sheath gpL-like